MKTMPPIKTLSYSRPFDENFYRFILRSPLSTAYTIEVNLGKEEVEQHTIVIPSRTNRYNYYVPKDNLEPNIELIDSLKLFEKFLNESIEKEVLVYFSSIKVSPWVSAADKTIRIYELLQNLGDNQHLVLLKNWWVYERSFYCKNWLYDESKITEYIKTQNMEYSLLENKEANRNVNIIFDPSKFPVYCITFSHQHNSTFKNDIHEIMKGNKKFYRSIRILIFNEWYFVKEKKSGFKEVELIDKFVNLKQIRFTYSNPTYRRDVFLMIPLLKNKEISYSFLTNKNIYERKTFGSKLGKKCTVFITISDADVIIKHYGLILYGHVNKITLLDFDVNDNSVIFSEVAYEIYGLKMIAEDDFCLRSVDIDEISNGFYVQHNKVEEMWIWPTCEILPWMLVVPITIYFEYKYWAKDLEYIQDIADHIPISIRIDQYDITDKIVEALKVFYKKNVVELYSRIRLYDRMHKDKDMKEYLKWHDNIPTLRKYTLFVKTSQQEERSYIFRNASAKFRRNLAYMIQKKKDLNTAHITSDFITIK